MTELLFRTGKELFCSASAVSGTAVAVPGGYSVSGKWGYGSGCLHADWALNGLPMRDGNGEIVETAMAFLDLTDSACTILSNCHVAGMAGSGSNIIVANDLFVPHALLLPPSQNPPPEATLVLDGRSDAHQSSPPSLRRRAYS